MTLYSSILNTYDVGLCWIFAQIWFFLLSRNWLTCDGTSLFSFAMSRALEVVKELEPPIVIAELLAFQSGSKENTIQEDSREVIGLKGKARPTSSFYI